jgi:hypothetical protein
MTCPPLGFVSVTNMFLISLLENLTRRVLQQLHRQNLPGRVEGYADLVLQRMESVG